MKKISYIASLLCTVNLIANQSFYEAPSFIGLTAVAVTCGMGASVSLWQHHKLMQEHNAAIERFSPAELSQLERSRKEVHASQMSFHRFNRAAILNNRVNYEHAHQPTTSKAKRKRYCQKIKQLCGDCPWTDKPLLEYAKHDAFLHKQHECEDEDNWRPQRNQRAQTCLAIARAHFDMQHSIANEITDLKQKRTLLKDNLSRYSRAKARRSVAKNLEEQADSAKIAGYSLGFASLASLASLAFLTF